MILHTNMIKAVIIGATGATGKELVAQLLEDNRFEKMVVWVRRSYFSPHPKLEEVIVDFDRLGDYADSINADVAFSCLGTTLKDAGSKEAQWKVDHDYNFHFAKICQESGVKHFILLSAVGVAEDSRFFYNRMKGTLEENIKKLGFEQLTILQPGMILRPGTDRPMEKFAGNLIVFLNRLGLLKKYRAISTSKLASEMIKGSLNRAEGIRVIGLKDMLS